MIAGRKKALVFLHIPKTGGTTLHNILAKTFPSAEICPERYPLLRGHDKGELLKYSLFSGHYDRYNIEFLPHRLTSVTLLREPKSRIISLYRFWRAHKPEVVERDNLPGPSLARKLSLAEFLRHKDETISYQIDNTQVRTLLGSVYVGGNGEYKFGVRTLSKSEAVSCAIEYLETFREVGVLEHYEESVRRICESLGLAAPLRIERLLDHRDFVEKYDLLPIEDEEITKESDDELERLTEADRELYRHALRRFS
jgi:Sulfotransferase family